MTDAELRQLVAALARTERRFLLWAAHHTTPPLPPEPAAPPRDWVVVLIDTFRGQTYLVQDYARLMQDFPALPPTSVPGIQAGWQAAPAPVAGRMSWSGVRQTLYAVEQASPACHLEAIEHGAEGWACRLSCLVAAAGAIAAVADVELEPALPQEARCYVTVLTAEAATAVVACCHSTQ